MVKMDDKYIYNQNGSKSTRVGQAVHDILSVAQPTYTVEDIIDGMSEDFTKEMTDCIEKHKSKYRNPFYILVLTAKMMWADNVIRNWFIARQTPPHATDLVVDFPNHIKTLYIVDTSRGLFKALWSLPGKGDIISILKDPMPYDDDLVHWIYSMQEGKLDKDFYDF